MGIIESFSAFAVWGVKTLPAVLKANTACRKKLRDVVGDLADQLIHGMQLVELRLEGARHIKDETKFTSYVNESATKLFKNFSEFKVCQGLRELRDDFESMFNPCKAAVSLGNVREVKALLYELESHERTIMDETGDLWARVKWEQDKAERLKVIDQERRVLRKKVKQIRSLA